MQPFVAVGLKLKEHGHRVRIASHAPHRSFVEQFGLEFYPLGGDPQVLADFAVQSKGVVSCMVTSSSLAYSLCSFAEKPCAQLRYAASRGGSCMRTQALLAVQPFDIA